MGMSLIEGPSSEARQTIAAGILDRLIRPNAPNQVSFCLGNVIETIVSNQQEKNAASPA